MIITCEECSTRFNLDDSLIQPKGTKVRCSQCKHVFTAFAEPAQTPAPSGIPVPAEISDSTEIPVPTETPDLEFDDPGPSSQTSEDNFDDISFDEPELSGDADLDIPDAEDTDLDSQDIDFDSDEFDQNMDLGLDMDEDPGEDMDLSEPDAVGSDPEMEMPEPEESEAMDFDFDETDISFEEDDIEFESEDLGFEDTLAALDSLESGESESDDIETGILEVDAMETVEMESDTDLQNLEMETDELQNDEIEIDLPDPGLEMEETEPDPDDIQFDEPEEIDFDEPAFEESESAFPDLDFEEEDSEVDGTADIEISFDDDEDDAPALADVPLKMESQEEEPADGPADIEFEAEDLSFEDEGIEFEETDLPTDAVGDEDAKALSEIDFQGLETEEAEATIPDLELSFEDDPDADLVFEEDTGAPPHQDIDMESDAVPALEMAASEDEDLSFPELDDFETEAGKETEEDGLDLSFDETDIDVPLDPFEEDDTDFQDSLDAELEDDKFSGYDTVLDQEVEPGQELPDFDRELKDEPFPGQEIKAPPPLPPELHPAQETPSPASESALIDPLPDKDVRKRRARQKKSAIGTPIKVLFLLFLLVMAAYAASLRFGYPIPFLSDLKIPYLTEAFKPEPPPKPVLTPVPNEVSINGRFVSNETAGELFIVTGKVDNPSDIDYSHIRVKGTLITKDKAKATDQIIYCGNIISEEMLSSGNISDISKLLTVKEGLSKTNVNIKPGKSVQFMLVFSDLPENLANFTVEIMDFQPGAKK